MSNVHHKMPRLKLPAVEYQALRDQVLKRDGWRCQLCGKPSNLHVHHINSRGRLGDDTMRNLITLCANCHENVHRRTKR
jgi:5-methylcytosine-specific restriction endonuclease McrA